MSTTKVQVKSRTGRDLLPDGLLLPSNVSINRSGDRHLLRRFAHRVLAPALSSCPVPLSSLSLLPISALSTPQATVDDLKARFAELKPRYYPSRQRFTLPPREGARSGEALAEGKRLSDYGLEDDSVLIFKDLGPQVGS